MSSDAFNAAHAINRAGCEHQQAGAYPAALDCYRRALARFEQTGDVHGRIMALVNVAEVACQMDDPIQATAALDQAQRLIDITPDADLRLVGAAQAHRGWSVALAGDLDTAEGLLLRGLQVIRRHGDSTGQERETLKLLAVVLEQRGDHDAAARIVRQIGD
jgi:tetratricopeptide (TPR) repeat protein